MWAKNRKPHHLQQNRFYFPQKLTNKNEVDFDSVKLTDHWATTNDLTRGHYSTKCHFGAPSVCKRYSITWSRR
jgi:hypothetical protein